MNCSSTLSLPQEMEDDRWLPKFGVEDIWKMLSEIRSNSAGSDDIPTLLYKRSSLILADPIYHLIVESIRQRRFPNTWKISDVVPIPKLRNSSIHDARPISLLPKPAKIAEKIILKDLRPQFSRLLGDLQFGIRKGSSTTHAIIAAHDSLTKHFDNPDIGAIIFLSFDFTKAFDKVMHDKLLLKAQGKNLPTGFIYFLKNYLEDRFQRVRYRGCRSLLKSVTSGVPQGSLLGPYLFGLYASSLSPCFPLTCMIKYVDDVCLSFGVKKSNSTADIDALKLEIENVSQWAAENDLTLNMQKTNGFVKYRGNFQEQCAIETLFPRINFSDCVKFLGIFLDSSFGWESHVSYVEKKCAQRIYILRRMKSFTSDEQFKTIYSALIRSLIEYACPAFIGISRDESKRLQKIQDRCLKIKGDISMTELEIRRRSMAVKIFKGLPGQETFISQLTPSWLPSGRISVPFCRTARRRNAFLPHMCISESSTFSE